MKVGNYKKYIKCPFQIYQDKDLNSTQRTILSFIWSITANKEDNKAIIQSKVLEEMALVNRMSVYSATKRLEELGYISKRQVKTEYSVNRVTEYTLNIEYLIKKYNIEIENENEMSTPIEKPQKRPQSAYKPPKRDIPLLPL